MTTALTTIETNNFGRRQVLYRGAVYYLNPANGKVMKETQRLFVDKQGRAWFTPEIRTIRNDSPTAEIVRNALDLS